MKRTLLLQLLEEYRPADRAQQEYKERMQQFVRTHENCFERTLVIGHVTASAWLINPTNDKALLMHHAKLNRWIQLGGHCDGDGDVRAVALREAREESGIEDVELVSPAIFDLDIHIIPANSREAAHDHYDVRFLCRAKTNSFVQNSESKELRWVGAQRTELPTEEYSVVRMFDKWRSVQLLSVLLFFMGMPCNGGNGLSKEMSPSARLVELKKITARRKNESEAVKVKKQLVERELHAKRNLLAALRDMEDSLKESYIQIVQEKASHEVSSHDEQSEEQCTEISALD